MAKVYLVRLYLATISAFALVLLFIASSPVSFFLPYMFQPTHIDGPSWDMRFQTLTCKILTLPLLLGSMYNLFLWGGSRLTVREVDALFALKRKKESRLHGVLEEEDGTTTHTASALRTLSAGGDVPGGGVGLPGRESRDSRNSEDDDGRAHEDST